MKNGVLLVLLPMLLSRAQPNSSCPVTVEQAAVQRGKPSAVVHCCRSASDCCSMLTAATPSFPLGSTERIRVDAYARYMNVIAIKTKKHSYAVVECG